METRRGGASVGERGFVDILFVGLIVGSLTLGAAAAPAVSDITLADADPTSASSVDFTVTFDESVTGVDTTDFVVDASGIAGASIDAVSGGGTTWTVSVGTGTGDGTLSIDLIDDDSIEDGSGTLLGGTGAGNGDFTAGASYTIDKTSPTVPTKLSPVDGAYLGTWTPTLSWEPSSDTGGSGLRTTNTYRYDVDLEGADCKDDYTHSTSYHPTFSSDGVYTWRLYSRDNAGNHSDWTDWHTFTVDTDKPDVTIDQAGGQADPTNASPVVFAVEFDGPIDGPAFTDADVSVGGTATTGTVTVTEIAPNDGTMFRVSIVVTGDGTVQPTIPAGGVEDLAGNTSNVSTSTDNSVTVDTDPPVATGVTENPSVIADANVGDQTFTLTIGYDEPMDTGMAPTVSFATALEDPSSTIALDPASGWTNDTTYVARYDVVDANEEISDIDARVTGARDLAGNAQVQYDEADVFSIDTANPTITWNREFPAAVQDADTDCSLTFPIEILVTDNCCIDAGNVVVTVSDPPDATVAHTLAKTQEGTSAVRITGGVTLSALTDGEATVTIDVNAEDCCGNGASTSDAVTVIDDALPTVSGFAVAPHIGRVDGNCEELVTVIAVVRDNCCIDAGDVVVTPSVTNASLKDDAITVTKTAQNEVMVSGTIVVHSLTGCPAAIGVEIDATDCAGNRNVWTENAEIEDRIVPVVRDLRVDEHVVVDACCEAIVTFDGYVEDNCCVRPDGIAIEVGHPTGNATVEFAQATDVTFTQCLPNRVDFSGEIRVRCLTGCPADIVVTVDATDSCGNRADEAVSVSDPADPCFDGGDVYDEVLPIPRDDPRQDVVLDESSIIDPLVEARLDGSGMCRLLVREDTPARFDVVANDADNCSCEDCAHPFDPCGGDEDCEGCCAAMTVHEIVTQPTHGTATIEDGEGDCSGGSVIRFAPDHGYVGPDEFTYRIRDACGNVSSAVATVYVETVPAAAVEDVYLTVCADGSETFELVGRDLWINSNDPNRIPFVFEVVGAPAHGVLSGDLRDITYTAQGATTEASGAAATIELTYTPAADFTGHDSATIRFADPFGGFTDAWVDIEVVACAVPPVGASPIPLAAGKGLSIVVPSTFASGAGAVMTLVGADGAPVSGALNATWDETMGRFVLTVDGGPLPPGTYVLTIPLGNGETVELTIEACAPDP